MGCKILKRVALPWPCPFQGRFLISRVGLAMINQCSKYEVSRFTRCEAMNSGAKCTNWGSWGRLWVTQGHSGSSAMSPFDRVHTTSYSTLIETMCLSYTFSRCSRLFVESRRFDPPHLHLTPPQGVIPVEFRWDLWHPKNWIPWAIVWCCLRDPTFSRFSRAPTCDRQTDGHRATASTADA